MSWCHGYISAMAQWLKHQVNYQELMTIHGVKIVQIRSFFWSVFTCIFLYSPVFSSPDTGKTGPEKTAYFGNFHAVIVGLMHLALVVKILIPKHQAGHFGNLNVTVILKDVVTQSCNCNVTLKLECKSKISKWSIIYLIGNKCNKKLSSSNHVRNALNFQA